MWKKKNDKMQIISLCLVRVAEWPPFEKELLIRLTIYHFSFEDRIWVLIVHFPSHCLGDVI